MTILVTGSAGFIGSEVCHQLLSAGRQVFGIDNRNDAYDPRLKDWRLEKLMPHDRFTFQKVDLLDEDSLSELFATQKIEAVINLAARAGVPQSMVDPKAYFATNVTGVLNLLELMREHEVKQLVQASSSSVYGNGEMPFREDAACNAPISPYAASKKAAEELTHAYSHLWGINTAVLRFFTVYGPAGRPDMSVFRFIRWISEGQPLRLHGDGSQHRDFTHVSDVARGVVSSLNCRGYEVINLGSDRPISILSVIGIMEKMIGVRAKIIQEERPATDVDITHADIHKAQDLLNWSPVTDLEVGLQSAVDWYNSNRTFASGLELY